MVSPLVSMVELALTLRNIFVVVRLRCYSLPNMSGLIADCLQGTAAQVYCAVRCRAVMWRLRSSRNESFGAIEAAVERSAGRCRRSCRRSPIADACNPAVVVNESAGLRESPSPPHWHRIDLWPVLRRVNVPPSTMTWPCARALPRTQTSSGGHRTPRCR